MYGRSPADASDRRNFFEFPPLEKEPSGERESVNHAVYVRCKLCARSTRVVDFKVRLPYHNVKTNLLVCVLVKRCADWKYAKDKIREAQT